MIELLGIEVNYSPFVPKGACYVIAKKRGYTLVAHDREDAISMGEHPELWRCNTPTKVSGISVYRLEQAGSPQAPVTDAPSGNTQPATGF